MCSAMRVASVPLLLCEQQEVDVERWDLWNDVWPAWRESVKAELQ